MDRIRVLHYCGRWLSQTETWLYNQVRHLPDEVENYIVCGATSNLDQFALPNLHSLSDAPYWRYYWDKGLRRLKLRPYLGFLISQAKKWNIEILHSHFGPKGWANIEAARRAGVRHVVTFYGVDVNHSPRRDPRWRLRYKELFAQVDAVLCEGPHMRKCIVDLGCPADKVHVHHLGIPVSEIAFIPRSYVPGETLRVLIAATFREKKGIPYALQALGRLKEEVPLAITIIGDAGGKPQDEIEKQRILRAIDEWQLRPSVRLLGFRPYGEVFQEAYKHHVFLAPSVTASDGDTEGGAPVVVIEMAATGIPIVSTTHCDIPAVIKHGQTGLLAPERDADALLQHLRHLVRNPSCWRDMTVAGRRHVEREYDAAVQGERLADVYKTFRTRSTGCSRRPVTI